MAHFLRRALLTSFLAVGVCYSQTPPVIRQGQPITAKSYQGVAQADQYQTGGGNNGISNALGLCAVPCFIDAPQNYSPVETMPWGGVNFAENGWAIQSYPYGAFLNSPVAGILDYRSGVPQWLFHGAAALDNRHYASPTFGASLTTFGAGRFSHQMNSLGLFGVALTGGRNMTETQGDKTNWALQENYMYKYTNTQIQGATTTFLRGFAQGDTVGHMLDVITYGNMNTEHDEGGEAMRYEVIEGGETWQGFISTLAFNGDGTSAITATSQVWPGFQGEGRLLIDMTLAHNDGLITSITNVSNLTQFNGSGTNWDTTYGTSVVTTSTAPVFDPGSVNVFPEAGVNLPVTSSAGFVPGRSACVFDFDWECDLVTAVPDGTHVTFSQLTESHPSGATVTQSGLAGYAFEMVADRVDPANLNGITTSPDSHLQNTVRHALPIMFNVGGESLTVFHPSGVPAGAWGGYQGRAFKTMGSGGSAIPTVTGSALTSVACSGGAGYTGQRPPQLVMVGSWATKPVAYVSSTSGGAISVCTVSNPGTGVTSLSITVDPENPYVIYPATKVTSVYNGSTGLVDGSFATTAWAGTPSVGDLLEEPHHFTSHNRMSKNVVSQYVPSFASNAGDGLNVEFRGIHGGSDAASRFQNFVPNCLYQNYPGCNNSILGFGQMSSPNGHMLLGPWNNGLFMDMPPQGGPGGFESGALVVRCGGVGGCPTTSYPFLSGYNGVGEDVLAFSPTTGAWTLTSKATSNAGGSPLYSMLYLNGTLSLNGPNSSFTAGLITATTQAHLADSLLNAGFSDAVHGYNFSQTPSSTFDFGMKYAVSGGLALSAYNVGFANNSVGFFVTHPTTGALTDAQFENNQGLALRSDWKIVFCSGTNAGGLNAACTPGAAIGYTGTPGNVSLGTLLGLQDGTLHVATVQSGGSGPTLTWGASAPVGACVNGSFYGQTGGTGDFYFCKATAWVLK